MAELTPSQFATLRDSVCEAVSKEIAAQLSAIAEEQNHLLRALVEEKTKVLIDIVATLQDKQADLDGRFSRLENADQYSITRRALMKLLEQTDVA